MNECDELKNRRLGKVIDDADNKPSGFHSLHPISVNPYGFFSKLNARNMLIFLQVT